MSVGEGLGPPAVFLFGLFFFVKARNAGKLETLEEFERCAAAGGNVGHLVCVAESFNSCCGVAAADDGDSTGLCNSLRNGTCTGSKVFPLGNAHRTVPDYSTCTNKRLGEELLGSLADVKTHPAVGNGVGINAHPNSVFLVLASDLVVYREEEVYALFSCSLEKVVSEVKLVILADRSTDGAAHSLKKV